MKILDKFNCKKCNNKPSFLQLIVLSFISRIKCKKCGLKNVIPQYFSVSTAAFGIGLYHILRIETNLNFISLLSIAMTAAFCMVLLFGKLVDPIQ
ncbi:hypothetical protein [Microbulbifer spongiae]|uniref:Prepilin peptidase n=1 Tax=Microbulbifer spongiae TaxID=2944933 RepID=A0ABY9EG88_9GAMM|nr:hypothetical protein [Microbulbifer sp. MI-G]WKD51247.1 hypothetical protein M8T91_07475 [Microbulbifer sp. MI-G]